MRWLLFSLALCLASRAAGQLLPEPDPGPDPPPAPSTPLIYRDAVNKDPPARSVDEAVSRLRGELREVAQSTIVAAEKRARMQRLVEEHKQRIINEQQAAGVNYSVEGAIERLQQALYEEALDIAPDEETRDFIVEGAPRHLLLERARPFLIAPRESRGSIVLTRQPVNEELLPPWWRHTRFDTEALALEEVAESPVEQLEPPEENLEESETEEPEQQEAAPVEVAVLADEQVTVEMHDDTTILRGVETEQGDLVLFGGVNIWVGGAFQYDHVELEDIFASAGGSDSNAFTRRAEATMRATLFDLGEVKLQYDFDGQLWRDVYIRQADEDKGYTLTVGNQAEPMSQENLLGNKFNAAMEPSGPTSAFATGKGLGVLLNKWFEGKQAPSIFSMFSDNQQAITTAIGIFGEDLENSNDTDWAVTGRTTAGRRRADGGIHIGFSGTYRDGEFNSISPRPELQGTDRVTLARFDAGRAAVGNLELMGVLGSWHGNAEFYYADYRDGEVDATGYGGYAELGYYLTGQSRAYRPRWGLWAPLKVGARNIFEVFGRVSYTRGDSDSEPANDLRIVTLGGSWYRHQFRVSANLLYSETDRPVRGQDDGFGAGIRFQYLF